MAGMEKSMYALPGGENTSQGTEDFSIEVILPGEGDEYDEYADDTVPSGESPEGLSFSSNLAEFLEDGVLGSIATDLIEEVDNDKMSRKDWEKRYSQGIQFLGLKYDERSEPWEGACGVFHPIMTEAAIKFQAETITETFPAAGPVKTEIIGKETRAKQEAAERVQEDMNYRLTEQMPEYRPEHERMLFNLAIAGSSFKKVYYDVAKERQVSMFVPAEDIIVPYGVSDLESTPRITHVQRKTKNEVRKLQVAGFYRDISLDEPYERDDEVTRAKNEEEGFDSIQNDDRYFLYEINCELDIEGFEHVDEDGVPTGIALPYVVTIERGSHRVLSVYRNWEEDDPTYKMRQHFVHYVYIPGFGFYGLGLIHLIGGFAEAATSILRQLVDAGTLANLPGGLKTRGLRIKGDDTPINPGEFRDVDIGPGALKDNIMLLPYKEPSATLFQLLQNIVEEGRRLAAQADVVMPNASSETPVGTTLAILERKLKMMSSIQARVHAAMRRELKLLKGIIEDNSDTYAYPYEPESGQATDMASDYAQSDILPVSDPNAATMSQRVVQYQTALQLSSQAPQIYDLKVLHRQMLQTLNIPNADEIVPMEEDLKPKDPISENMDILTGEPVKAFMYQDHDAHIAVHMSAMDDPKLKQMLSQNPQAPAIQAAAMAHLQQHLAFKYRKDIEAMLGTPLPPEDTELSPELEVQVSQLAAAAGAKLLQKNMADAAQQQAQQQMQDPVTQIEFGKLEVAKSEVQRKAKADQDRKEIEQAKLVLQAKELEQDAQIDGAKLGLAAVKAKAAEDNKMQLGGVKAGIESMRSAQQIKAQREGAARQERTANRQIDAQKETARLQAEAQKAASPGGNKPKDSK